MYAYIYISVQTELSVATVDEVRLQGSIRQGILYRNKIVLRKIVVRHLDEFDVAAILDEQTQFSSSEGGEAVSFDVQPGQLCVEGKILEEFGTCLIVETVEFETEGFECLVYF